MSKKIPIAHAMIAWNPKPHGDGMIAVMHHGDEDTLRRLNLSDTDGACWCFWEDMSDKERYLTLATLALDLAADGDVDAKDIKEAFGAIPEFVKFYNKYTDRHEMAYGKT